MITVSRLQRSASAESGLAAVISEEEHEELARVLGSREILSLPRVHLDVPGLECPVAEVHGICATTGVDGAKYTADLSLWGPYVDGGRIVYRASGRGGIVGETVLT